MNRFTVSFSRQKDGTWIATTSIKPDVMVLGTDIDSAARTAISLSALLVKCAESEEETA